MKQHPDRQPGGAITVDRSNDYDRNADQQFERKGIDGEKPLDNFERNIPGPRRCQNVYEPNWNN
jgi:hypothetical protein